MTNREKLLQAAMLISQVADCLDLTEEECGHCNLKKRKDFEQFKVHQELVPMATKLTRFASLDNLKAVLNRTKAD